MWAENSWFDQETRTRRFCIFISPEWNTREFLVGQTNKQTFKRKGEARKHFSPPKYIWRYSKSKEFGGKFFSAPEKKIDITSVFVSSSSWQTLF